MRISTTQSWSFEAAAKAIHFPNLSEECFNRQWSLIKTRAPTSMQKTCLFTLTQLFLE